VASIQAITTVSRAILALLERARTEELGSVALSAARTADLATPPADGVALVLHRLSPRQTLRSTPPGSDPRRPGALPPLPVDLHYLVTAWGPTAERQQLLLAWVMRTLEDTPVLSAALLNRSAQVAPVFREHESVELLREPFSQEEFASLWESLRSCAQPAVPYVARTVLLDPRAPGPEAPAPRR